MTSVLEPIIVSKVPNSFFLKGYTPLTNEQVIIKDVRGRFANLEEQQVIWIRKIKSIGYDVLIDSFFLGHKQRIEQLVTQYNDKKKCNDMALVFKTAGYILCDEAKIKGRFARQESRNGVMELCYKK
ncbi:hypothetical protein ACWA2C_02660 [Priestia megaterium]